MSSREPSRNASSRGLSRRQQVLLAALDCSDGDLEKEFTAEQLLLAAWKKDPGSWGLRGYEKDYPDSERIYIELDRASVKGGMIGLGLFDKVRQRTYRLTMQGLSEASAISGSSSDFRQKADRALGDAVSAIISHTVFQEWLKDQSKPKYFREAGHFWGIAPGTPPAVIKSRIRSVDSTLDRAHEALVKANTEEFMAKQGKVLFNKKNLDRAQEFHSVLKTKFARDLSNLKVDLVE